MSDEAELDEIIRQRSERLARIAEKRAALEREEADEQLELLSAKVEQLSELYEIPPNFSDVQLNPSDENPGQYRFAGLRNEAGEYHVLDVDASQELTDFVDELGLYETSPLFENNERNCPILQLVDCSLPASDEPRYAVGPITQHPVSGVKTQSLTLPARQVELEAGAAPEWPDGWRHTDVGFGEDDSGRFHTSWTLEDEDGEQFYLTYTDFDDGADFGEDEASLPYDDVDAMEMIRENIETAHSNVRKNSFLVGRGACEQDPALEAQVLSLSLGTNAESAAERKHTATSRIGNGQG